MLRQYFSQARLIQRFAGAELLALTPDLGLLRTGVGLDNCQQALQLLNVVATYDRCIQFGVSGSLSETLPIHSLVVAKSFSAEAQPVITTRTILELAIPDTVAVQFYSSTSAITNATARDTARIAGGQAVDMESYAIARYCQQQVRPLLALRCISDQAGPSTPVDFRRHYQQAATLVQRALIDQVLKTLKVIA